MKHYRSFQFSFVLALATGFLLSGCGDKLLPPDDGSGTQTDPNKITLKGDLVLESPLPDDAKVVLVWLVSAGSPDYHYIYGKGTINRAAKTFEITLTEPPPLTAVNWYSRGSYDTGFGAAYLAVVADTIPEGQIFYDEAGPAYGMVNYSNLLYFNSNPDWSWMTDTDGCHDWTKHFDAGYKFGTGVPVQDGCTFDGFTPASPTGLKMIISTNPDRFDIVNWT